MQLSPDALAPVERYKLLIGLVVPRPIAWVSSSSRDGLPNLAPYSFFAGVGSNPLTVVYCPANNSSGGDKDSLANSKPVAEGGTGVFAINGVPERHARAAAASAEDLAYGESEFDFAGVESAPCAKIACVRVADAPWTFECETLQVVRTNPGVPGGGNLVVARVVHVHVDDALLDAKLRIDADRLDAVGRMGGFSWVRTKDRFEQPPGRAAVARPG
jgi:flavin reductase (DIM6/NTAB) family NADH-FMN oxidoreductase RutF